MKVRLQADNDLDFRIVRATGHLNTRIALQAGLHGNTNPEVLQIAAMERRVLVSHDRRTMPKHFGDFIANAVPNPLPVPEIPYSLFKTPKHLPYLFTFLSLWRFFE